MTKIVFAVVNSFKNIYISRCLKQAKPSFIILVIKMSVSPVNKTPKRKFTIETNIVLDKEPSIEKLSPGLDEETTREIIDEMLKQHNSVMKQFIIFFYTTTFVINIEYAKRKPSSSSFNAICS